MPDSASADLALLDQKQAESIGRFFNLTFNSALLYGGEHQSTLDNAAAFHAQLGAISGAGAHITLLIERESVFVESFRVDRVVNCRRITAYCKKAGIQSITFENGLQRGEVQVFARVIGELREAPSVEAMQHLMQTGNVRRIRINYIVFRKVTSDEEVVDKQNIAAAPPGRPAGDEAAPVKELLPVFTLHNLLSDPALVTQVLNLRPPDGAAPDIGAITGQLRAMAGQVHGDGGPTEPLSGSQLAEAVACLRRDITRSMEMLKTMGTISAASDSVTKELDNLTYETIIRIIRDEYRHGSVSVKRLAQIIRRILPEVRELKLVLPGLRKALTEEGMQFSDYLQLVNSLVRELNDDALSEGLSHAAEEMGLSAEDIIAHIKSDPGEAARLIVLASELKSGPSGGERLSDMLALYVEQAGRKLAATSAEGAQGGQKSVKQYATLLLDALGKNGVEDNVVKRVAQKLSSHNRGFDLPKGIFDIKVTTFFLDQEIKRYLRYNTPFSAVVISVVLPGTDNSNSVPEIGRETSRMIPNTLTLVKKMLRELDLVGVMVWISDNVPFIILPMTDEQGALSVKNRLGRELNKIEIPGLSGRLKPLFVVSVRTFDRAQTPDCDSFIKNIMALHADEVERERGARTEK